MHEMNPMMGHRGCRIGVTTPEIYQTQVQAIFEASIAHRRRNRCDSEVMIPLISTSKELEICRSYVIEAAEAILNRYGCNIDYKVGTMIELPRAALTAKSIARHADFFSFGTNDLTQMTFGFSRDDMGKFLPFYLQEGVLEENPLSSFDIEGVGELASLVRREDDMRMHGSRSVYVRTRRRSVEFLLMPSD